MKGVLMPGRGKKEIYLPYRYHGKLSSELKKQRNHYFPSLLKKGRTVNKKPRLLAVRRRKKKNPTQTKLKKKSNKSLCSQEILLKN